MKSNYAVALLSVATLASVLFFQNCAQTSDGTFADGVSMPSVEEDMTLNAAGERVGQVISELDSAEYINGRLYIKGWACQVGSDSPISVSLGTIYYGFFFAGSVYGSIDANQPGEEAIATKCQSSHGNHRFSAEFQWQEVSGIPPEYYYAKIRNTGKELRIVNRPEATPAPSAPSSVIGVVDEAREDQGELLIRGWACVPRHESAIAVHFYAGGAGAGTLVSSGVADVERESAVASACQVSSSRRGFEIRLTQQQRNQFRGQAIYIYGISPTVGSVNPELNNSGRFKIF